MEWRIINKMLRIFCDKCKKDFSEEYNKAIKEENFNFIKIKRFTSPQDFFEMDLCQTCSNDLINWLQPKEENNE